MLADCIRATLSIEAIDHSRSSHFSMVIQSSLNHRLNSEVILFLHSVLLLCQISLSHTHTHTHTYKLLTESMDYYPHLVVKVDTKQQAVK